jgi:hypothetical protein
MIDSKGRMTLNWNDPEIERLGQFMMPYQGKDYKSSPYLFDPNQDFGSSRAAMNSGQLTPQQYVDYINSGKVAGISGLQNAAVNPNGSISFDNYVDTKFDPGIAVMAALSAGVGGLAMAGAGIGAGAAGAAGASGAGAGGLAALEAGALAGAPGYGTALSGSLGGAAAGAGTGAGMDWFEQLMQNYNPDLGFQGLNEAGSSLGNLMPAAVPESPAQLAEWGLSETAPGVWEMPAMPSGGGIWDTIKNLPTSALKSLGLTNPDGSANGTGLMNLLGKLGAAGLGAYGANQQSNSLNELASKYSEYGAPSRARFEASMSPGFDPMSIPGYSGALDTASKGVLARLSAGGGNPFGNPGGLIDAQKQIVAGTAMPAINEYQRLNLSAGGLGNLNAAVPSLQSQAIGADGNVLNALGYGLNAVTNPQPSLADIAKALSGYDLKYSI